MDINHLLEGLRTYIAPNTCNVCGRNLIVSERIVCSDCSTTIRQSMHENDKTSSTARLFWGLAPVERAGVLFVYMAQSPTSHLLESIKYRKHISTCKHLGRTLATFYLERDFFQDIDVMVPVPLSAQRFKKRGYNQSEKIAEGVASLTQLPIDTQSVRRKIDNQTQTHLTSSQRLTNVEGIFEVVDAKRLDGKHILIIDDIVTTGATTGELIRTIFAAAPHTKFSVLALGRGENILEV